MTEENQTPTVLEIPTFDFSECEIKDDAALEAEMAKLGNGNSYFQPGKHDVVIDSIVYTGLSKKDPNWGQLTVTYKGTKDKTIRDFLMIPFKDVKYGEKKTMYPYKKFKDFCGGLGVELTVANLASTLKSTFSKPERLVGTPLSIDVGYRKGYVKYSGKTDEGVAQYTITLNDGNTQCGDQKQPIVFPDRAAALTYAKEKKIAVDEYVNVLGYAVSANGSLATKDVNW